MTTKTIAKQSDTASPNVQYELFTAFFGDAAELSNTIELWDSIPKYAVSQRMQNRLRKDGRLQVYEQRFVYATRKDGRRIETECFVAIQPASIKFGNGYKDFYPSVDEELLEDVIRKIFADQQCGHHNPKNMESWVRFSVQMLRKELKARGKTRSADEIKRSIEILRHTHISLYLEGAREPIYSAPILSDVTRVTRQEYLEDASQTWLARLPALISKSVNELSYRQFNYGVLMCLSTQLARWMHKRLSHSYTNASVMDVYEILFSSIKRDSALLPYSRIGDNLRALEATFQELVASRVLLSWERKEERREGRKIVDVKYCLRAHPNFITDVKAANARLRESRARLNEQPERQVVGGTRRKW